LIKIFSSLGNVLATLMTILFVGVLVGTIGVFYLVFEYSDGLPDYSQLAKYSPPTTTRLYAADGRMMEEYAKENRLFVPINAIPKRVVNAFIAAEDKNFYTHPGIDFASIMRAGLKNLINLGHNKTLVGGSTITQQVVKNFLLTNEKSLSRKIKEAILAFRITQAYSKDKIMELYLNEIYLGNRSYGVAAAALDYFNKSMDELTIEEAATLASLPKAPSSLDPRKFPAKAKERRDWVISRMAEDGYINEVESLLAISKPITVVDRSDTELVNNSAFFSEAVRQELTALYGEESVYEKGLAIRTTLDPDLQNYAQDALRMGLVAYDRRHGWRGAITKLPNTQEWQAELKKIANPVALGKWRLAVVLDLADKGAKVGFKDSKTGIIPLENLSWARKYIHENRQGSAIHKASDVLAIGDVVAVSQKEGEEAYHLEQIPNVNGAIVALDPHTGKVLALVGGYYYGDSQFNRAIQAKRQPGSAFKPFVYLAALENGYAPNSIIVDEAMQLGGASKDDVWTPKNYSNEYYGPTPMRVGVEKSRNAMTVRLAQAIGINKVVEIAKRFGITDNPEPYLSTALGASETTVLKLTNAYAMIVNGGKKITPSLIERIQNSRGKTIFRRDNRACLNCSFLAEDGTEVNIATTPAPPIIKDERATIAGPIETYQMTSILEGVIQRGTGTRLLELGKVLAGKTGTTNESFDTWFVGFNADLAVGVYVGFDTPRSLGKFETGAAVALPVWKAFMEKALANRPDIPFRRPEGVKLVKIDVNTGRPPTADTIKKDIIFEAFKAGTEPGGENDNTSVLDEQPTGGTENFNVHNTDEESSPEDYMPGGVY
jgi:penicillin-binding protein 1A